MIWPFKRNPGRELSLIGHRKRARTKREQAELRREVNDELAARFGKTIPWARG